MNRIPERRRYYDRVRNLIDQNISITPEQESHWAKYQCILISGYLEVSIKEILHDFSNDKTHPNIMRYVEASWPRSQNMNTDNIEKLLKKFNSEWAREFSEWLKTDGERQANINSLIEWRNRISHGKESATTGVTRVSVRNTFNTAHELVCELEKIVPSNSET